MNSTKGFELCINNKKYLVEAGLTRLKSTGCYGVSNQVTMFITVYDENNKMIRLDKDSYVAEKISDFIKNSVNGQDTCYWDFYAPNRHFKEELKDDEELDKHLDFSDGALISGFEYKGQQIVAMPLKEYDKLMKKEKALEIPVTQEEYAKIKKELESEELSSSDKEILDILKKHLKVKSYEIGIEDVFIYMEDEEDYAKIRKWLESEESSDAV